MNIYQPGKRSAPTRLDAINQGEKSGGSFLKYFLSGMQILRLREITSLVIAASFEFVPTKLRYNRGCFLIKGYAKTSTK